MKTLLVTGSSGLIGSEVCVHFGRELCWQIHGVDNNQRAVFFGPQGDTRRNRQRLQQTLPSFVHHELDIRDRAGVSSLLHVCDGTVISEDCQLPTFGKVSIFNILVF
jgi:CDP-paratose 2-epimerase